MASKWFDVTFLNACPLCGSNTNQKLLLKLPSKSIQEQYRLLISEIDLDLDLNLIQCNKCSLGYFNPQLIGTADFYKELSRFDWYYLKTKPEYLIVQSMLSACNSLLEYGCGKGDFKDYLPVSSRYVGIELNPTFEMRMRGIVTAAEMDDSKFDVVCSFQFMEHVSQINEILEDMWSRVLPNGKLIIAVPSWDSFLHYAHDSIMNIPPHHLSVWGDDVFNFIESLLGAKKLIVVHEEPADFHRAWIKSEIVFKWFRKILRINNGLIYDKKFFTK
jgi:SAM-dependent methyltransferase